MKLYKSKNGCYYVLSRSGEVLRNITCGYNLRVWSGTFRMLKLKLIGNNYKGRTV